ncbi:prepilin-type N-terminal cleavage/methylation domain-containing protein [Plantibacter flavus]|uniref:Prepilin-type N-terminal cleavage/methylation domain-containing protein n=1 Tax=Plantibacter flavus TaxID=150123 RepID=A0A3N2BXQ3_9MICO|nr:prepilin-type N-terminal cleavage/methylation domain-containing protein [Plantibacter flavus]ROR80008.1 prepilin-type N-terminal cleavage/methylation domain-containing protein [Plantibacter flavus]SMG28467.1 prepilin-type N-terminal cleavage/methylation domain-containing protein [Plantibacter flavus]
MHFDLLAKLDERRRALRENKDGGFTLVELIVVVLVVGILAGIAVPIYIGVQNNAKDSAVQADLANAKTAVVSYMTTKGSYADLKDDLLESMNDLKNHGLTKSQYVISDLKFTAGTEQEFCITALSETKNTFYVTSAEGVAQAEDPAALPTGCDAPTEKPSNP